MKRIMAGIKPLAVSYLTQTRLACHQQPVYGRFVSTLYLWFEPAATCLHLRYSVSYAKIKLRQTIFYEGEFLKIKTYIALNYEMRINTQFENTITNYKKYILTIKMVLHVDRDKTRFAVYEAASYVE